MTPIRPEPRDEGWCSSDMNPCPCGNYGDPVKACICSESTVSRYRSRISGPLLDRIDLFVEVPRVAVADIAGLWGTAPMQGATAVLPPLTSRDAAVSVARARRRQMQRSGCLNGELPQSRLQALARPTPAGLELLEQVFERLSLTARSYHRVLQVALTIADLQDSDAIEPEHIAEAVQLRRGAVAFRSAPVPVA